MCWKVCFVIRMCYICVTMAIEAKEHITIRVDPKIKKWVTKAAKKASKRRSPFIEEILIQKMKSEDGK